jgi:sulfur carrier protein ThiS adenylyltransferase
MRIKINERFHDLEGPHSLYSLQKIYKPDADVLIVNGFAVLEDRPIQTGDEVVLIRRGEVPSREEFETLMTARHSPGVHEKIRKGIVGIAGLGGLGSSAAVALARLGVGKLVLADYDVVEPSNLNRQQYFADQIGMSKVTALTENLKRIHPYLDVKGVEVRLDAENLTGVFAGCRVIVEAFDSPEAKAMLFNTVLGGMPETYIIGVSGLAGFGPSEEISISRFSKRAYWVGDGTTAAAPGTGLMSPRVGVAAHHQANLVLRLLLGMERERK